MAFRRGRRKRTVAWLPVLGQNAGSTDLWLNDAITVLPGLGAANISTNLHAVVPDYPAEAVQTAAVETLADYQQSGYRLKRIVGRFAAGLDQDVGDGQQTIYPEACLLAMGLIILRVDSTTGAPLRAATPIDYSPLGRDNVRDPWIFRRTWVLGNRVAFAAAGGGSAYTSFPPTTESMGGVSESSVVDQTTARRVTTEERLILAVSTVAMPGISATTAGRVRYCWDARYLTSPLRVMGNRNNASR